MKALPSPVWDNGVHGVWPAEHVPPAVPRSPTRKTWGEAVKVDPATIVPRPPVGPGSRKDFVKVQLKDIISAYAGAASQPGSKLGSSAGTAPDPFTHFPHVCQHCNGGRYYQGAGIDYEHWPEEVCPGRGIKKPKSRWT